MPSSITDALSHLLYSLSILTVLLMFTSSTKKMLRRIVERKSILKGSISPTNNFFYKLIKLFYKNNLKSSWYIDFLIVLVLFVLALGCWLIFCYDVVGMTYHGTLFEVAIILLIFMMTPALLKLTDNSSLRTYLNIEYLTSASNRIFIFLVLLWSTYLLYGSVELNDIIKSQNYITDYGIIKQPVGALLFFIMIPILSYHKSFSNVINYSTGKSIYDSFSSDYKLLLKLIYNTLYLVLIACFVTLYLGGANTELSRLFDNELVRNFSAQVLLLSFIIKMMIMILIYNILISLSGKISQKKINSFCTRIVMPVAALHFFIIYFLGVMS